jgi:hypothetical protein
VSAGTVSYATSTVIGLAAVAIVAAIALTVRGIIAGLASGGEQRTRGYWCPVEGSPLTDLPQTAGCASGSHCLQM